MVLVRRSVMIEVTCMVVVSSAVLGSAVLIGSTALLTSGVAVLDASSDVGELLLDAGTDVLLLGVRVDVLRK